jgi:hypothetical protein
MKITFDLEYIGETTLVFNNKLELFNFYDGNNGRIFFDDMPFYDEFKDFESNLSKIGTTTEYITISIYDSLDDICTKQYRVKANNEKIEEYKNIYREQLI